MVIRCLLPLWESREGKAECRVVAGVVPRLGCQDRGSGTGGREPNSGEASRRGVAPGLWGWRRVARAGGVGRRGGMAPLPP